MKRLKGQPSKNSAMVNLQAFGYKTINADIFTYMLERILIKLKHIINGAVVSELDLPAGNFTIGRNHGNSLQLDDGVVSGEHAALKLEANSYLPEALDGLPVVIV